MRNTSDAVHVQRHASESAAQFRRQFSIRDLLKLTLLVSVILAIGALSRDSKHFVALSTPWTAVSLVPIGMVYMVYRWQLAFHHRLVFISILCYVIALALPAMGGEGDIIFGVQAALMSFVGLDLLWDRKIEASWPWGPFYISIWVGINCALGAAANVAYFIGIASCWFAGKRPRAIKVVRCSATIATFLAITALLAFLLDGGMDTFYPGCGLWIASFLALALGTIQSRISNDELDGAGSPVHT